MIGKTSESRKKKSKAMYSISYRNIGGNQGGNLAQYYSPRLQKKRPHPHLHVFPAHASLARPDDERLDKLPVRLHGFFVQGTRLTPSQVIPIPKASVVPHDLLEQPRTGAHIQPGPMRNVSGDDRVEAETRGSAAMPKLTCKSLSAQSSPGNRRQQARQGFRASGLWRRTTSVVGRCQKRPFRASTCRP